MKSEQQKDLSFESKEIVPPSYTRGYKLCNFSVKAKSISGNDQWTHQELHILKALV